MGNKKKSVTKEYLKIAEVSEYSSISQRTLHTLLKDHVNPIPHYRVGVAGRIIRIKKSDFDAWMDTQRATQGDEIDELIEGILK